MTNCPRHPDMPSTDLCVECGDYVCGQCGTVLADRRVLCPSCAERVGVAPPPPVESVAPASWEAPPRPKPRMGYPKYETIEGGRGRKADASEVAAPAGNGTFSSKNRGQ